MEGKIIKILIEKLIPHESILEERFKELLDEIKKDGFLLRPIVVSKLNNFGRPGFYLIHNGHHRARSLKALGCKYIIANVLDFWSDEIKVFHYYEPEKEFPKEKVIEIALNKKDLKPRQTKHFILIGGQLLPFHNNDVIEPKIYFPLEKLK